jgi:hypothetical protein
LNIKKNITFDELHMVGLTSLQIGVVLAAFDSYIRRLRRDALHIERQIEELNNAGQYALAMGKSRDIMAKQSRIDAALIVREIVEGAKKK